MSYDDRTDRQIDADRNFEVALVEHCIAYGFNPGVRIGSWVVGAHLWDLDEDSHDFSRYWRGYMPGMSAHEVIGLVESLKILTHHDVTPTID